MRMYPHFILLGSLVVCAAAQAGGDRAPLPGRTDEADKQQVEVRFANGSTVLMQILQEQIEVQTQFGKLTIPPREIRQIEFGVHLTEEAERRIDAALKQLSSAVYRQRELAERELVTLGPQAYLALHRGAKDKDEETAKRAQKAIKLITQKVSPRLLRLQEDDRIRTSKFTVVGRIVTPGIKARAEYFGDLELKPTQLLTMRWLESSGETEVVIDAARYGSAADRWMETDIRVEPRLALKITASGQVDLWPQQPGQYMTGPGGMAGGGGVMIAPGGVVRPNGGGGSLLGRIGEDGTPFVIGERTTLTPGREGRLYLHILPSPWGNTSTGSYRVRITIAANASEGDE